MPKESWESYPTTQGEVNAVLEQQISQGTFSSNNGINYLSNIYSELR